VFRSTKTVDWRCQVAQSRDPEKEGWFRCDDGGWTEDCGLVTVGDPADGAPAEDVEEGEDEDEAESDGGPKRPWVPDVVVRRGGDLILPVTVRVTYENGESADFEWTREMQFEKNWWRLPLLPGQEKVASVVIDPDRLWFLDKNMSDNQWFADKDELAGARWGERAAARASSMLQWFMAVGG